MSQHKYVNSNLYDPTWILQFSFTSQHKFVNSISYEPTWIRQLNYVQDISWHNTVNSIHMSQQNSVNLITYQTSFKDIIPLIQFHEPAYIFQLNFMSQHKSVNLISWANMNSSIQLRTRQFMTKYCQLNYISSTISTHNIVNSK
jgi:hypothetical protein